MSDTSGNVIRPGASGEQGPDADPEMDPIRSVANIQCSVSKSSSVFSTVNFGWSASLLCCQSVSSKKI